MRAPLSLTSLVALVVGLSGCHWDWDQACRGAACGTVGSTSSGSSGGSGSGSGSSASSGTVGTSSTGTSGSSSSGTTGACPTSAPFAPVADSQTPYCTDGTQRVSCSSVAGTAADGQDGQVVNASSYAHPTSDTTLDPVTGLQWERDTFVAPDGGTSFTFAEVFDVCAALDAGAYHDWRVPTLTELLSIDDLGAYPETFDHAAFDRSGSYVQWTSSISGNGEPLRITFFNGEAVTDPPTDLHAVRCVRGGGCAPGTRFSAAEGGVVFDALTNLAWTTSWPSHTWLDALAACRSFTTAAHPSGWRLPTEHELATLASGDGGNPALDGSVFPVGGVDAWSSSPVAQDGGQAWYVSFSTNAAYRHNTTDVIATPCVHDGP